MPGTRRHQTWSWLQGLPNLSARWFTPSALFILSFGLHYHTLWGGFVWDDRPAVVGNRDVWTDSPWGDMWRHDFWGQKIASAESHKSFRPLTTLTYRLSNIAARRLSKKGQDNTCAADSEKNHEHHTNTTGTTEVVTWKAHFARGTGPEHADAVGFHLFNVIVHAAACSSSVWLFRAIFAGEELPAAAASLLFTVHPVHVEAVAPMVGRADLLCGLLSVIALILTITGTARRKNASRRRETRGKKELEIQLRTSGSLTYSEQRRGSSTSSLTSSTSGRKSHRHRISNSTTKWSAKEGHRDPTFSSANQGIEEAEKAKSRPKSSFEFTVEQPRQDRLVIPAPALQDGSCLSTRNLGSSSPLSAAVSTASLHVTNEEAKTTTMEEEAPLLCLTSGGASMAVDDDNSEGTTDDGDTRNESEEVVTFAKTCRECSFAIVQEQLLNPTVVAAVASVAVARGDGANSSPGAGTAPGDKDNSPVDAAASPGEADEAGRENEEENQKQGVGEQEEKQRRQEGNSPLDSALDKPTTHASASAGAAVSCCFSSEEEDEEEMLALHKRWVVTNLAAPPAPLETDSVIRGAAIHVRGGPSPSEVGADAVTHQKDLGPGVGRYCTALLLAAAATLCKEVGITTFGLMAGGEIVRFFEHRECRQQREQPQQRGQWSGWSVADLREKLRGEERWQRVRQGVTEGPQAAAAKRMVSAAACACSLIFLHMRLRNGVGVREWGVLENDISILPSRKERALSYSSIHAMYASKLLWPAKLCYDWGFSCIPHVTSVADPRNLASLTLYASILAAATIAVVRCDTAVMWGLALVVVPFLPASNILFPVGVVIAERLLYLPSLGVCILAGCMLRRRGGSRSHDRATSLSPSSSSECLSTIGKDTADCCKLSDNQEDEPPLSPKRYKAEQKETDNNRYTSVMRTKSNVGEFLSPSDDENQDSSASAPGQPSTSFSSRPSTAMTRATECRSSRELLTDKEGSKKYVTEPRSRVYPTLCPRLSARRTTMATLLLVWAAFFGAKTLRRCKDWSSERALFESALEVCPDGIKTLNNLGVGMLNEEEAGRAEVLLRRAVELHPEYGSAFFNLGVSLMITRDHAGAVFVFERSLELEPRNTKAMVYLGQVYLELTLKALESPPDGPQQGVGDGGSHHGIVGEGSYNREEHAAHIRSSPPESLLTSAEFYTDRALDAGTGLPLARLVKGQALSLRGQHQLAAGFLQESIEISLYLLSGQSGTIATTTASGNSNRIHAGVAAGSMEALDAVDLTSTYNRLGLALQDSGSDPNAVKEAFLAGLSLSPDDFSLLVNGGAAHQTTGDTSGAKALYHRALSLQPNSPELLNNVGWLEEQSGGGSRFSLETAAELYERALGLIAKESPALKQVETNVKNVRKRLLLMDGGK